MYFNKTIQRITAGIMLLLFALSVTPKQWLHDVVTGHKHNQVRFDGTINLQASKNNFICNWHNDALESPFTDQAIVEVEYLTAPSSKYVNYYFCSYYSTDPIFSALRGPPAMV